MCKDKLCEIKTEIWLPVLELYSFNSKWEIVNKYMFKLGDFYISSLGRFKRGINWLL